MTALSAFGGYTPQDLATRGYEVDEANSVRVHSSNVRGFAHLPMRIDVR